MFINPIDSLDSVKRVKGLIKENTKSIYALTGLISPARALFLYSLKDQVGRKLVVLPSESEARTLYDEYKFLDKKSLFFPSKDLLFYESDLRSNELTAERVRVLKSITLGEPVTVFTCVEALLNKLPPMDSFKNEKLDIKVGARLDLDEFRTTIVAMGYEYATLVSAPGEYSIRGGIIDIFPLTEDRPRRVELWDTEVDSIRVFDADSQKSLEQIQELSVFPASELVISAEKQRQGIEAISQEYDKRLRALNREGKNRETMSLKDKIYYGLLQEDLTVDAAMLEPYLTYFYENTSVLTDYFKEDACIFLEDVDRLYSEAGESFARFIDGMEGRLKSGLALDRQKNLMISEEELFERISKSTCIAYGSVLDKIGRVPVTEEYNIKINSVVAFKNSIPLLKKHLEKYHRDKYAVIICGTSKTRQKRLADSLFDDGILCHFSEDYDNPVAAGDIVTAVGVLSGSFVIEDSKTVFISESDIFGTGNQRRQKKAYKKGEHIESFRSLAFNDYVVHENYGVGQYKGLEQIVVEGQKKEYLKIAYKGDGKLFVPVDQLDIITKYAGRDSERIKLNTLGTSEWSKTKARAKAEVDEMAGELIRLYATRHKQRGYTFGPDTVWQREFEETFPFEETAGQLEAIEQIKADLESEKIMDRLICGDVGFGKTEIALRAAFKVVQDSKQVAFLVPTTVLAKQHYNTFVERMKGYPVRVEMLSRFRTNAQNKATIEGLKNGEIDIVIGTHKVLSKDVGFKDLGLLVIDEEQRFGVRHKEKIKMLKNDIDVLCLSATPIPRTLHMSLVGIRDLSLLDEAPLERRPVQTFVFEQNDEMIREAISRELSRGGQVYYVVNKIADIEKISQKISELVPNARVVYAHGQMHENDLEDIMADFVEGEVDVLVATTIVELGLDISNVNTIIIQDADRFGLSQLYQLRGRVGRSSRTAYAFLMYQRNRVIHEVAKKRLMAIKEFSDLGSGFQIARRDLEIRGAGDVFGAMQHGHVDAVGYELYCKYLQVAIENHQENKEPKEEYETVIDIFMDSYVPESFISDEKQRLEMYRRMALIKDDKSQMELLDELIDRFGEPPHSVINLTKVAILREKLHSVYVTKVQQGPDGFRFDLYHKADINAANIPEFIKIYGEKLWFDTNAQKPGFFIKTNEIIRDNKAMEFLWSVYEKMSSVLVENLAE